MFRYFPLQTSTEWCAFLEQLRIAEERGGSTAEARRKLCGSSAEVVEKKPLSGAVYDSSWVSIVEVALEAVGDTTQWKPEGGAVISRAWALLALVDGQWAVTSWKPTSGRRGSDADYSYRN
ncbi:hypothetical protein ACU8KH_02952 [Lachancea thermotolerans]